MYTAHVDNGNLVLTIPMATNPLPSKSGKSRIVATSGGNHTCADILVDGVPLTIGFNAYIK